MRLPWGERVGSDRPAMVGAPEDVKGGATDAVVPVRQPVPDGGAREVRGFGKEGHADLA